MYATKSILVLFTFLLCSITGLTQISKIEIRTIGLTCSMCSNAILKQLETIPEVDSLETDLNTSTFIITLKKGSNLNLQIIKDKVEKAGFFVGKFIVTAAHKAIMNSAFIVLNQMPKSNAEIKFQVLDKGYVTEKEYKKLLKLYKGVATYKAHNEADFHIKIMQE